MKYSDTVLTAEDSTELFVRHYQPLSETAARTLMIVHGVCEHGERYEHFAELMIKRGWNVIASDLRGHGLSGGVPVHIRQFRQYVHDIEQILRHFELRPEQTAMLGHSMGGLVALRFGQLHPDCVSAIVLISPLLGIKVPIPLSKVALGRVLSYIAPRSRFRSIVDPSDTTRNPVVLEKRKVDTLMHRSVTAGWFFAMRSALQAAWIDAQKFQLPVLVMQSGDDRVVDSEAPPRWLEQIGSDDATFHNIPDALHELLNEPDWKETSICCAEWLEERIENSERAGSQQIA